ncbi:hypothetical protein BC937DRAFT_90919 [Endogone sp. FLAS-F59071]|nr:hypothetical protein BC937DRAFT_90919 [Endogone sp. FLAS-F59071]|eukprot:RUS16690.1 hypothetical protein BC937DRAFT_90919 [Endogone sp. FLAS-F59071]
MKYNHQGINDIFQTNKSPQAVFEGLRETYQACEEFKVDYVIGCSLLEVDCFPGKATQCAIGQSAADDAKRNAVNEYIAAYSSTSETTQFMFFDLCKKLPLFALSAEERRLYWDDGVHLTAKGYDRVGELVFELLKPLVTGEGEGEGQQ